MNPKKIEQKRRFDLGDDSLPDLLFSSVYSTSGEHKVPNIVHYIWFGCREFRFHHYLSLKSVIKIQKPVTILFHTDCLPHGKYFREVEPHLRIVKRTPPQTVWGKPVNNVEHQSDVARLQILLEYGGIYLDDDVIILKVMISKRHWRRSLVEKPLPAPPSEHQVENQIKYRLIYPRIWRL